MVPGYELAKLPGSLPTALVEDVIDLRKAQNLAHRSLEDLNVTALNSGAIWRDWLALTGQVRTIYSREKIVKAWSCSSLLSNINTESAFIVRPIATSSWIEVPFSFTTKHGNLLRECTGRASLIIDNDGELKIWMIVTVMENFANHGHPDVPRKEMSIINKDIRNGSHGYQPSGNHINGHNVGDFQLDAVILGAGQCGLSLAGRLGALGLTYVILEKQSSPGGNWTRRYETVRQHTIREYNNLPFGRTWKESDPSLLPGKIVAEGFANYINRYNINVWFNTNNTNAGWDSGSRLWKVQTTTKGETRSIICKHLITAMGAGVSDDYIPEIAGTEKFCGILMSSGYYKHSRDWESKDGVVVGSGTMAHDIAQDMYRAGLRSVTMVQRGKTAIYPIEWVAKGQEGLYNTKIPTSFADAITIAKPNKISRDIVAASYAASAASEPERFAAVEAAGFQVDKETPMFDNILQRYGGYYIDVGASTHIARGDIKVKSGVPIKTLIEGGVEFEDGTSCCADVIVLATGQKHDFRGKVATIVGKEYTSKLSEFWGLDEEGEIRNLMKAAAPGFWMFGGSTSYARWFSRFIALGIQSDILGEPLNCVKLAG